MTWLGIDIGTSAVKAILVDDDETVLAEAEVALTLSRPQPGWSEQDPEAWWQAVGAALASLRQDHPAALAAAAGIGLSGQMHGPVLLDAADRVIRPTILWNDGRATAECAELTAAVPDLALRTGVPALPGLTAPKLLWLRRHEPGHAAAIARILLPKDFIRLRLTGEAITDMSDAAGTLWLDQARRDWYQPAILASRVDPRHLPRLVEATEAAGRLRPDLARDLGLPPGIPVAGGGDTAVGAVGIGAVAPGDAFLALSTSAQVFVVTDRYRPAPDSLIHAFAHALPDRWFQMAALLNGASTLAWAADAIGGGDIPSLLAEVGARGNVPAPVLFLPYLAGERTPHGDPAARGVFFGITGDTTRAELIRAVLEGVAFSLVDGRDAIAAAGPVPARFAAVGGGARSRLWLEIIASALGQPVILYQGATRGPAFGAARLARRATTGAGSFPSPGIAESIDPDPRLHDQYMTKQEIFRALYLALRPVFALPRL